MDRNDIQDNCRLDVHENLTEYTIIYLAFVYHSTFTKNIGREGGRVERYF